MGYESPPIGAIDVHAQCVVLGLQQNGLGVVRALGRRGVRVQAVDSSTDMSEARTRYARALGCMGFRDERLVDALRDIGRRYERPPVLILTTDRGVEIVSAHRAQLEEFYRHSLPAADVIDCLMDKTGIARYAEREGFQIPRTFSIANAADLDRAAGELGFPCILKPQLKTEALMRVRTQKAYRIESLAELRRVYGRIAPAEPNFVMQEWIPGPDTSLIFCLYYFDKDSRPLAYFGGRKIRQYIPYCGTACSAEPFQDDYVRDAGIRFFQRTNYTGFGAIEFKRSPSGEYYLVEPTVGRTEHLFALAAANGVNLPYIGYCDMAGVPVEESAPVTAPVRYLHWKRDLQAARVYMRAGELSVPDWLSSIRGPKQYALFAWDDLKPWQHHVVDRLRAPQRVAERMAENHPLPTGSLFHEIGLRLSRWRESAPASVEAHLTAALDWIGAAQDSRTDGGVPRAYTVKAHGSLKQGWQPAYPETTGYIIPTLFDCAHYLQQPALTQRAIRMADWLLGIQHPSGGLPGGTVAKPRLAVVFNTGMVMKGWARAFAETANPAYLDALTRAGDFLIEAQDADGAWRRYSNVDGHRLAHCYDVLSCWPLLQTYQLTGATRFRDCAVRNLEFALSLQRKNGWFELNDLREARNNRPLTHTIGYSIAGFLECGVLLGEQRYLAAAECAAAAVRDKLEANGWLSGEFFADWTPAARWSCLTGNAQMSIIWMRLWQLTGTAANREAALRANAYLRSRQDLVSRNPGVRGGLAGSQPLHARYGRYQYLNWATKYLADALLAELRDAARADGTSPLQPEREVKEKGSVGVPA